MKKFQFSKYCSPAQLYLVLGMIGIIGAFFNNYSIETLLTNALFLVVWAWVLNWLCSKGFKAISWILVLLPFIMALFTYFLTKDVLVVREGAQSKKDRIIARIDSQDDATPAMTEQQKKERQAKIDKALAAEQANIDAKNLKAKQAADKAAADEAAARAARNAGSANDTRTYDHTGAGIAKGGGIAVGSAVVGGVNPVAGAVYDYFSESW